MIRNLLLAATLLATAPTAFAQTIAITGGRVVTNTSQGVIENGTVVITNGRITSVGTGAAPAGATLVDAKGKWITPGLFAALSRLGLAELDSQFDLTNNTSAGSSKFQASLRAADSSIPTTRPLRSTALKASPASRWWTVRTVCSAAMAHSRIPRAASTASLPAMW